MWGVWDSFCTTAIAFVTTTLTITHLIITFPMDFNSLTMLHAAEIVSNTWA